MAFMFDIETLDTESTTVILSAAIIHFGETDFSYEDLIKDSLFVKFDAKEQMRMGRSVSKDTLEWWAQQNEFAKKTNFTPMSTDVKALDGIGQIMDYIEAHGGNNQTFWARGSLDQMAIGSLTKSLDIDYIAEYYKWRDVRTAIDCMCTSTNGRGYCEVNHPTFNRHNVVKHHPVHDCALDVMMLRYGV
jgi:hypothetical protein